MKRKIINTKNDARQQAIDWQSWQSNKNMSYSELVQWQSYFVSLARKFHLIREFTENGII